MVRGTLRSFVAACLVLGLAWESIVAGGVCVVGSELVGELGASNKNGIGGISSGFCGGVCFCSDCEGSLVGYCLDLGFRDNVGVYHGEMDVSRFFRLCDLVLAMPIELTLSYIHKQPQQRDHDKQRST